MSNQTTPPRNRRAGRAQPPHSQGQPRRGTPRKPRVAIGTLVLFAAVFFLLVVSLALSSGAKARLTALREERALAAQQHQEQLNYYAGMRTKSGVYSIIHRYAAEYNVNPSLISAVISRESHYDPYAESRVGARGLMQIMEDTGTWIASRLNNKDYSYDHLFDPDLNIRFGTWYLAYLSDYYQGNPVMMAAAYHAGANNVNLWALKYADDERYLTVDQIPTEDTKDYVRKVMNAYAVYYEVDQSL